MVEGVIGGLSHDIEGSKLGKALSEKKIILVVVSKSLYHEILADIVKRLAEKQVDICYVALSQPYASVKNLVKKAGAASFYFIDVLTSSVDEVPQCDDCVFVPDPHALTELGLELTNAIEKKECEWFLFDALSTMMVYHPSNVVLMFSHNAINKLRVRAKGGVFLVVSEDTEDSFVKDLTMFSDEFINFVMEPLSI